MLGILVDILSLLLVSGSFPIGYIIGTYAESEIEDIAKKIGTERFFNVFLVLAEVLIISAMLYVGVDVYFLVSAIIITINLVLCAFYTAAKSDLVKTIGYEVLFIVLGLIASLFILLV